MNKIKTNSKHFFLYHKNLFLYIFLYSTEYSSNIFKKIDGQQIQELIYKNISRIYIHMF